MHSRRPQGPFALPTFRATLLGAGRFGSALLGPAISGCTEQPGGGSAPLVTSEAASSAAAPVAAPFDVASAIERARASFYEHDGRLVAGSETHRVELDRGTFTFVPAHDTALETLGGLERLPTRSPTAEARTSTSSASLVARSTRIEAETGFGATTAWVGRGALRADGQIGETRTVDGAVLMVRGGLVEELRNTREGLEQSWHFAAAPEGQDDLVVRVSTSGMTHVATTLTGEHFADSATGLGVRYGHGTFVDADGVRTAVPVAFEGGQLVLRVPAEVIDEAAYPAVLDPTISAEITIDAPVTGPRGGNQLQAAVAGNGVDTYLVAFTDGLFGEDDVRAARFRADGTLIDSNSFPIALATGSNQSNPAVSWNGTSWIVAWQDGRNLVDWDIYATTVSTTGAVGTVDGAPLAVTPGVNEQTPALASAGATTLVSYRSGDDATSDVVGLRLNATGVATDAVPFVIGGGAGVQTNPQAVASATAFLVSFDDDVDGAGGTANAVRVRRVNASGSALPDASSTLIAANAFGATVGWSGATTYLVAWTGLDAGFYAIFTGTVPVTGAIVAPTGVEVTPGALDRDYLEPQLAWNGSEYLLAYLDAFYDTAAMAFTSATIGARRLTSAGAASGAAIDPTSISANTNQVDVSSIGSTFYLVYTDQTADTDIRGTRITGTTVSSPAGQLLSSGPNDQTSPVVASSGTGWAVAWRDFRSAAVDAWAAILDTNGAVSGAPALIASGVGGQGPTGIAWAGSRYLVIYDDAGANIRAVTLTASGIASAPFDIAVSPTLAALEGSVACGPAAIGCLVTFTEYDTALPTVDTSVRARRVDASTPIATVGAPVSVVVAADNQFDSDVAASNTGFYVVWSDARTPTDVAVRGTRFLSTPTEVGGTVLSSAAGAQVDAQVASDGTDFLVAFVDQRSGGATPNDVYFQRVSGSAGTLLGGNVAVATSGDNEFQPTVAFSGRYLLAWAHASGGDAWIEATRLATSGTIVDTTRLTITELTGLTDLPTLAGGTGGRWLLAYRNFTDGPARTRARLITDDLAVGATCSAASACASGFCVDGVCCATACAGGTSDCNACSVAAGAATDGTCGPITGCGDAGGVDAGMSTTDAGEVDGGGIDGGGIDGGGIDGGGIDGGGIDGGGIEVDAGTMSDTGGVTTDTGIRTDTGMRTDAGTTPPATGGCACSVPGPASHGGASGLLGALALGLTLVIRRRMR